MTELNTQTDDVASKARQALTRIRTRWPIYVDMGDEELANAVVRKFPIYEDRFRTILASKRHVTAQSTTQAPTTALIETPKPAEARPDVSAPQTAQVPPDAQEAAVDDAHVRVREAVSASNAALMGGRDLSESRARTDKALETARRRTDQESQLLQGAAGFVRGIGEGIAGVAGTLGEMGETVVRSFGRAGMSLAESVVTAQQRHAELKVPATQETQSKFAEARRSRETFFQGGEELLDELITPPESLPQQIAEEVGTGFIKAAPTLAVTGPMAIPGRVKAAATGLASRIANPLVSRIIGGSAGGVAGIAQFAAAEVTPEAVISGDLSQIPKAAIRPVKSLASAAAKMSQGDFESVTVGEWVDLVFVAISGTLGALSPHYKGKPIDAQAVSMSRPDIVELLANVPESRFNRIVAHIMSRLGTKGKRTSPEAKSEMRSVVREARRARTTLRQGVEVGRRRRTVDKGPTADAKRRQGVEPKEPTQDAKQQPSAAPVHGDVRKPKVAETRVEELPAVERVEAVPERRPAEEAPLQEAAPKAAEIAAAPDVAQKQVLLNNGWKPEDVEKLDAGQVQRTAAALVEQWGEPKRDGVPTLKSLKKGDTLVDFNDDTWTFDGNFMVSQSGNTVYVVFRPKREGNKIARDASGKRIKEFAPEPYAIKLASNAESISSQEAAPAPEAVEPLHVRVETAKAAAFLSPKDWQEWLKGKRAEVSKDEIDVKSGQLDPRDAEHTRGVLDDALFMRNETNQRRQKEDQLSEAEPKTEAVVKPVAEAPKPAVAPAEPQVSPEKKEFAYRLTLRPASSFTVPDGFKRLDDDGSQFGTVVYDKPLLRKDIENFSLDPLDPRDPINVKKEFEAAEADIDSLSDFSERGFKIAGKLYSPDVRRGGDAWRVTSFTENGKPSGHIEFDSYIEARKHAVVAFLRDKDTPRRPESTKAEPQVSKAEVQVATDKIVWGDVSATAQEAEWVSKKYIPERDIPLFRIAQKVLDRINKLFVFKDKGRSYERLILHPKRRPSTNVGVFNPQTGEVSVAFTPRNYAEDIKDGVTVFWSKSDIEDGKQTLAHEIAHAFDLGEGKRIKITERFLKQQVDRLWNQAAKELNFPNAITKILPTKEPSTQVTTGATKLAAKHNIDATKLTPAKSGKVTMVEVRKAVAGEKKAEVKQTATNEVFIRAAKKSEIGTARARAMAKMSPREGYEVVYKPYGSEGKGFYYVKSVVDKQPEAKPPVTKDVAKVEAAQPEVAGKQPWEMTKEEFEKDVKTSKRVVGGLERMMVRMDREVQAEAIFEQLEDQGVSPNSVAEQFFQRVLPTFSAKLKKDFVAYLERTQGIKMGEAITVDDKGNAIETVDSPLDILGDLGSELEYLDSGQRGPVVFMAAANELVDSGKTIRASNLTELINELLGVRTAPTTQEFDATTHRREVERALSEGKPVSAEVLADYPDLKKEATSAEQTEVKPAEDISPQPVPAADTNDLLVSRGKEGTKTPARDLDATDKLVATDIVNAFAGTFKAKTKGPIRPDDIPLLHPADQAAVDTAYRTLDEHRRNNLIEQVTGDPNAKLWFEPLSDNLTPQGKAAHIAAQKKLTSDFEKAGRLKVSTVRPKKIPTKPHTVARVKEVNGLRKKMMAGSEKGGGRYAIDAIRVENNGHIAVVTNGNSMWIVRDAGVNLGPDGTWKVQKDGKLGAATENKFPDWHSIERSQSRNFNSVAATIDLADTIRHLRQAGIFSDPTDTTGVLLVANENGSLGMAVGNLDSGTVEINVQDGHRELGFVDPVLWRKSLEFSFAAGADKANVWFDTAKTPISTVAEVGGRTITTVTMPMKGIGETVESIRKLGEKEKPTEEPSETPDISEAGFLDVEVFVKLAEKVIRLTKGAVAVPRGVVGLWSQPLIEVVKLTNKVGRNELAPLAQKAVDTARRLYGELQAELVSHLKKASGKSVASWRANRELTHINWHNNGAYGYTTGQLAVEGKVPEDSILPFSRLLIRGYRRLVLRTGGMAVDRNVLIERRGKLMPFQPAKDGKRLIRWPTSELFAIMRAGPSDPNFGLLAEALAHGNQGVTVENAIKQLLEQRERMIERRAAFEIGREFENFPTHLGNKGRVIPLIESDMFQAAHHLVMSHVQRLGYIEHFGQTTRETPSRGEALVEKFIKAGGSRSQAENLIRALNAMPVDIPPPKLGTIDISPGSDAHEAGRYARSIMSILSTLRLTMSGLPNLPEPLNTTFPFVGIKPSLQAYWAIARHPLQLLEETASLGSRTVDVMNITIRPHRKREDIARAFRDVLLRLFGPIPVFTAPQNVNEFNEFHNAVAAMHRVAAMRAGRGTVFDRVRMRHLLNFSKSEVDAMLAGTASDQLYQAVITRSPQFGQGSTSLAAERSRLANAWWYRHMFRFDSYSMKQINRFTRVARAVVEADTPKEKAAAAVIFSEFVFGSTVAGITTILLKGLVYGGPALAVYYLGKAITEPKEFLKEALLYSLVGGPLEAFRTVLEDDGNRSTAEIAAQASFTVSEFEQFRQFFFKTGPYKDLDLLARAKRFATSHLAVYKGWQGIAGIMGLGERDAVRESAIRAYWDWRRKHAPTGRFRPGSPESESRQQDALFRGRMKGAYNAMRAGKDPNEVSLLIDKALGVEGKREENAQQSLRSRKLLKGKLNEEELEGLRKALPAKLYEALENHDELLELWAESL